jgi:hypothetical protein
MRHLICRKCGNTEDFSVGAKLYETWLVDSNGYFIKSFGGDDSDTADDYACYKCDSYEVEQTEDFAEVLMILHEADADNLRETLMLGENIFHAYCSEPDTNYKEWLEKYPVEAKIIAESLGYTI